MVTLPGKSTYAVLSENALPFLPFGSRVKLVLFLDANFILYFIPRQIGFSMTFRCRLLFPNGAQRKIAFSTKLSWEPVFLSLY